MKKIIAIGAAVVLSLSLSGSAMAFWFLMPPMPPKPEPVEVEIENEDMLVVTKTMAKTVTGENSQWGIAKVGDVIQKLWTGQGMSAAQAGVTVGMTMLPGCDCLGEMPEIEIENDDLKVITKTMAKTVTGENSQWGIAKYSWSSDLTQEMGTGAGASQAMSEVMVGFTGWSSVTTD
ncbi:hypothetical protein [Candidatus Chazhemtobacterium aquaticus]|uniref:Uncharacterized protein n=1 Tax=Candidatus Chazhemtobacterium aquaticus TaxID=2715735 RepID=A0A857NBZ0_9BACT|nr:hypothetical protein [Candidatus Chazhemtobacterium aquaticus]QHO63422.1 hypothetical protein MICH65_0441 [Candidatus Chazhemtobacterium aquaticus]